MFVCVCSREKFHLVIRAVQTFFLVLSQIFLLVISSMVNDYKVRNSKMIFNDSKIVIKGMTQLNVAMLVATAAMICVNYAIVSNSNKNVMIKKDNTIEQPKSTTGGLAGLLMNIFINLCTLVAGLIALSGEGVGLLNRFNEDLVDYVRLCDSLKKGNIETCEDKNSQHFIENMLLGTIVLFSVMCLILEMFKILIDVCSYCQESGKGCKFLASANLSYEKLEDGGKVDKQKDSREMVPLNPDPQPPVAAAPSGGEQTQAVDLNNGPGASEMVHSRNGSQRMRPNPRASISSPQEP